MVITGHQVVSNKGRPMLSACMIVKNEEKFLPQCLESIKNVVDEIIIVDTGSTDRTVEIAQSFGAKIYHHPWRNSFSEARNHSLGYATCDWILQVDADEAFEQADIPLLHKLIQANSYNAIFVAIYSDIPGGRSKHYYTRVFRRGKAYFEGSVHNQLIFEGEALPSEIRLYHYGYNLSKEEMQKKYKRTGELLRQQLAEDPNNIFALANLMRTYRNEYNYEEVIKLGEKGLHIAVSQTDPACKNQRQRIYIDYTYALLTINKLDRAEEICKDAINENPNSLDLLFMMGNILMKKKAFNDALNYYKKYLVMKEKENREPAFNQAIVDTYHYEHKAYNNIGECYDNLGLRSEAEVAFKKAIELNNREPMYYSNLAHLYASQNRLDETENITTAAIQSGIANHVTYLLLGKVQIMREKTHEAINTFKQLIQKDNKNTNAYLYLINLLIQTNQLKEAEETGKTILLSNPDHLGLKCLMERIKFKLGDKESPINFSRNILEANPSDYSIYLDLGNLCIEIEEYNLAIELLERYLKISAVADATIIANIATCYARLGKLDAAIIGLQAALKLNPTYDYALQNLAVLKKKHNSLQGSGVGDRGSGMRDREG